jgi:ammonia channel protein AmtB
VASPNGLLFWNPSQLLIQAIEVNVTGAMGFFDAFAIMKVIYKLIGVRVLAKVRKMVLILRNM